MPLQSAVVDVQGGAHGEIISNVHLEGDFLKFGYVGAAAPNAVLFPSNASDMDNFYIGCTVTIISGTGIGQTRTVTDYNLSPKVAFLDSNWTVTPAVDSTFYVTGPVKFHTKNPANGLIVPLEIGKSDTRTSVEGTLLLPTYKAGSLHTNPVTESTDQLLLTKSDGNVKSTSVSALVNEGTSVTYDGLTDKIVVIRSTTGELQSLSALPPAGAPTTEVNYDPADDKCMVVRQSTGQIVLLKQFPYSALYRSLGPISGVTEISIDLRNYLGRDLLADGATSFSIRYYMKHGTTTSVARWFSCAFFDDGGLGIYTNPWMYLRQHNINANTDLNINQTNGNNLNPQSGIPLLYNGNLWYSNGISGEIKILAPREPFFNNGHIQAFTTGWPNWSGGGGYEMIAASTQGMNFSNNPSGRIRYVNFYMFDGVAPSAGSLVTWNDVEWQDQVTVWDDS